MHPVSGTLGVIAARFLSKLAHPLSKQQASKRVLRMVKPALAAGSALPERAERVAEHVSGRSVWRHEVHTCGTFLGGETWITE
jgi:hypothetical protein